VIIRAGRPPEVVVARHSGWTVIGLLLVAVAARASAQAPGLPVHGGGTPRGVTIEAAFGFPNDDFGPGSVYAAEISYGARRFGIGAFVSRLDVSEMDGDDHTTAGVVVNLKVIGGPLVPFAVTVQAGAAYSRLGFGTADKHWHVPVGLGISWTFAGQLVALKPWIAPRLDLVRTTQPTLGTSRTQSDFGLSTGIDFGLLNGVGLQVAYDRVWSGGSTPSSFGVGLSFTFK
jgi:hypothetical protein